MSYLNLKTSHLIVFPICLLFFGCSSEIPEKQQTFVVWHRGTVDRYSKADNDLQYKEIWERRERGICEKLPDGTMTDWIGKVESLGINLLDPENSANINIQISERKAFFLFTTSAVYVQTLVGPLADSAAAIRIGENPKTAIIKGSPLYDQLVSLKKGDKILFSGQLVKDLVPGACFYEMSLSTNGKIRWPEYVARFTSIKKIN
jgi:hypothetical protein